MQIKQAISICLMSAMVALMSGCSSSEESAARKFWGALADRNLPGARQLVSSDTEADLFEVKEQATQIRLIQAGELVKQGSKVEFEGRFRLVDAPEGAELDRVITLVEEGGEWKVRFPADLLPDLVARAFWAGVAERDQAVAMRYTSANSTMALEQSWGPLQSLTIQEYGSVVVDGDSASVAMVYRAKQVGEQDLESATSLVREEGVWTVSAPATIARIFGNTMGEVAREALESMRENMEEAGKALQESMEEAGKVLQDNLEEAGKAMKEGLEALKREMEKLESDTAKESEGAI